MTTKEVSIIDAENILSSLIGEYAWFIRSGEDRILRLEFGEPHLTCHGPQSLPSAGEMRSRALQRRVVEPTGQWSLFVEDGLWIVKAGGWTCGRDDDDGTNVDRCLAFLSGQRVQEVRMLSHEASLNIRFDLGGVLDMKYCIDFNGNSSWILLCAGEGSLAQVSRDIFDIDDA